MGREILHIPARRELRNRAAAVTSRKIRVAAYCRVSTEQDEQLNSFENQVTYYKNYISRNPDYELAGIYADEGISGTSTRRREDFNRMILDCEAGKIDLVITKSISRFARNTQDCLNYSRKLKELGIGVMFEKEGINTMDGSGELLFTILSSLAQEESRSISENCQWGIRSLFKQGVLHLNANRFYGYDKGEDGKLVINQEQARIVRWVFESYMDGVSPDVLARKLNEQGVPGCMGEPKWATSTIMGMLQNEKHMGDAILQKTYTADFLTKKMVKNEGQLEQYYVKDDHPAIIEKEFWNAVQMEIERRKDYLKEHGLRAMGRYTDSQPFSNHVFCATCGKAFWRRTFMRSGKQLKVWMCGQRYRVKGEAGCANRLTIKESVLHTAFVKAWNCLLENRTELLPIWEEQAQGQNALAAFRAKRFMKLTEDTEPIQELDFRLVGRTLEHCTVAEDGTIHFYFLDGTELEVQTQE